MKLPPDSNQSVGAGPLEPGVGSAPALKCDNCGAVKGDNSAVDREITVNVRVFHGKNLCSDCEDAYCYSLES